MAAGAVRHMYPVPAGLHQPVRANGGGVLCRAVAGVPAKAAATEAQPSLASVLVPVLVPARIVSSFPGSEPARRVESQKSDYF